jgi:hypothetical protein
MLEPILVECSGRWSPRRVSALYTGSLGSVYEQWETEADLEAFRGEGPGEDLSSDIVRADVSRPRCRRQGRRSLDQKPPDPDFAQGARIASTRAGVVRAPNPGDVSSHYCPAGAGR